MDILHVGSIWSSGIALQCRIQRNIEGTLGHENWRQETCANGLIVQRTSPRFVHARHKICYGISLHYLGFFPDKHFPPVNESRPLITGSRGLSWVS